MIKKKLTVNKKESAKEIAIKETITLLTAALIKLKPGLGEKKFEKRIRKAAKLLTQGIKSKSPQKKAVKKKSIKKAVKKTIKTAPSPKAKKTGPKK